MAEHAKRRQAVEPFTEALDAPAFVIHGDEQRRLPYGMDLRDEALQLLPVDIVAAEQDHAADEGRRKPLPFVVGELRSLQIDHQRTERHG